MIRSARAREDTAWAVMLCAIATAYLWVGPYYDALNNPNENVRMYMTRAIVEHSTFSIDPVIAEWGYVNDKATFDGRMYAGKAPGVSFAGVPAYTLYSAWASMADHTPTRREAVAVCRIGGSVIPSILLAFWFAGYVRRTRGDLGAKLLIVSAVTLGSTMMSYAGLFASHTMMAGALFAAFTLTPLHVESPRRLALPVGMGLLLGCAIALEYPALLGALVIGAHALWRSPDRGRLIAGVLLGGLLPGLLVVWYHAAAFGGVLETPYAHLENPEFVRHMSGFYGMERLRPEALFGTYFGSSNGLFWFAPWTMVAVVGLVLSAQYERLREPAWVTLAILLAYTVFVSTLHNWRGGWTAGPRYIVGVVPFLGWYLLQCAQEFRTEGRAWFVGIVSVAALVLVGMFNCGISAATFPHYPEAIENPIFEVAWFALARGFIPHSVGTALGWEGLWSLAPFVAAHVVSLAVALWHVRAPLGARVGGAVATAALAAAFGTAQSLAETGPGRSFDQARAAVLRVWEPIDPAVAELRRSGRLPLDIELRVADVRRLVDVARALARHGYDDAAARLYERAGRPRPAAPSGSVPLEGSDSAADATPETQRP